MVEVVATDEFVAFYGGLDEEGQGDVEYLVGLLEQRGVQLGYPYSSALKGSRYALRELRSRTGRGLLRILYAFDPERDAVLLIGGYKKGDDRFYEQMVPLAERIWEEYLREQGTET
jgi:hypothetical protein